MKLISFVAISFLAITVSAQAPQSSRKFDQAEVEAEIARLTVEYETKEEIFAPIESRFKIKKKNAVIFKKRADLIIAQLKQAAADSDEKRKLEERYYNVKAQSDWLHVKYHRQYPYYAKLREVRDDAKAVLGLLRGNQDLVKKHNVEYKVETGPSLGSFYNLGFLNEQRDKILKDLETLLEELERIKGLLEELEGIEDDKSGLRDSLRVRRDELKDEIRLLQSQCKIAKEILREHKRSQSMGARFMKSLYPYMPNGPIE
ncbi:hypothetical protein BASA50_003963 [Batrachochytrium salamandrivorans]|uniref:Uncharacterized protein n=1 Tax=Batrachochytrium salamandrivorans TaxID=1357716 RepID=A0ABQ8FGU5_9FUNG|nr:hypothetical protein BASA60_007157 [Batrachochytrium salamandrivorans]KAH6588755.1 hypothetical protein BASA61_005848 [Batrachochytrium salamandrivorans]KAH6598081.1 hypothetical protein BASA50_003963 [Batrachochytrium salamandrivorans]